MLFTFPFCPEVGQECNVIYFYLPLILMGIFYGIYAATLWPCLPLILSKDLLGSGFGIAFSIQNLGKLFNNIYFNFKKGLFLAPFLVGYI